MNSTLTRLLKMLLILIIIIAIGAGILWKINNPSDYRHPRDREIKLY